MKRKAIEVKYRKTSESFPEYLKYEVTILNEDGTTEVVPAYGKDLQDALDRLVSREKAEKVKKTVVKVPWGVWAILWFSYLGALTYWYEKSKNALVLVAGIVGIVMIAGMVYAWLNNATKSNSGKK
jgi:hypothetical protein